jgi:hypothetical protein
MGSRASRWKRSKTILGQEQFAGISPPSLYTFPDAGYIGHARHAALPAPLGLRVNLEMVMPTDDTSPSRCPLLVECTTRTGYNSSVAQGFDSILNSWRTSSLPIRVEEDWRHSPILAESLAHAYVGFEEGVTPTSDVLVRRFGDALPDFDWNDNGYQYDRRLSRWSMLCHRMNLPTWNSLHRSSSMSRDRWLNETVNITDTTQAKIYLCGRMRVCDAAFRYDNRYWRIPSNCEAVVFRVVSDLRVFLLMLSTNGLVMTVVGTADHDENFELAELTHACIAPTWVQGIISQPNLWCLRMLRRWCDDHNGESYLDRRLCTTELSRRGGITRGTFIRIFGSELDFGDQIRSACNTLPADWRANELPATSSEPQRRTRTTVSWNWNRIPPDVAAIMQHDLTLHLDEPMEDRR